MARPLRYSTQQSQNTHPLSDPDAELPPMDGSAAKRRAAREANIAPQLRVSNMPVEQRKLINARYKRDRKLGKANLPYPRWLAKLFEITDAGTPIGRALSLMNLHLEGKLDGMPVPRTSSGDRQYHQGDRKR